MKILHGNVLTSLEELHFTLMLGSDRTKQLFEISQSIADNDLVSVNLRLNDNEIVFRSEKYKPETFYLTVRDSEFNLTVFIGDDEYALSEQYSFKELTNGRNYMTVVLSSFQPDVFYEVKLSISEKRLELIRKARRFVLDNNLSDVSFCLEDEEIFWEGFSDVFLSVEKERIILITFWEDGVYAFSDDISVKLDGINEKRDANE